MDLRHKCKNKQYANCIISIAKSNSACKYCSLTQQTCKYNGDHKNTWKIDKEYCFDNVRKWVSEKGFNDYYEVEL